MKFENTFSYPERYTVQINSTDRFNSIDVIHRQEKYSHSSGPLKGLEAGYVPGQFSKCRIKQRS